MGRVVVLNQDAVKSSLQYQPSKPHNKANAADPSYCDTPAKKDSNGSRDRGLGSGYKTQLCTSNHPEDQ